MTSFIVRPELRGNPPLQTYLRLHAFMAVKGFLNEAEGVPLPHATYFGKSDKTADELSAELSVSIRQEFQFDVIVAVAETAHVSVNGQTGDWATQLGRYAAESYNPISTNWPTSQNLRSYFSKH
jgi:hypothetical protein